MIHGFPPFQASTSRAASGLPGASEGFALGLLAVALVVATLALTLIPQRLAQRPASSGVILLRLDSHGQLRLWNHAVAPQELSALLQRLAAGRSDLRLRLVSDPQVPWGTVQQLLARLNTSPLPLELQLP